jgi:hypothetical protein
MALFCEEVVQMDRFHTHGDFSWAELETPDVEAAKEFYQGVFGWELAQSDMPGAPYTVIKAGGREVGGMMRLPPQAPPGTPPHWLVYVTVNDVDEVARKVEELGGRLLVQPREIPKVGRFCVLQDPQGAVLAAIQYSFSS